jgi:5-phospho-D-xylono-1,4-lactonase
MSFVRTILGDISPAAMGRCYAHEHLIIDPSYTTATNPDFLLDDVDRCSAELSECYSHEGGGARTMVDSMPMACGRNAMKLAEVSRRTGMHILCPTGLHLRKYYPPGHWSGRIRSTDLARLFVREIEEGIDVNDGNGPEWSPSPHRAGLIKVASGADALDGHEKKVFAAAADAHRATGAPILTHTEQGTAAIEQVEVFRALGVDVGRVTLSHTDRKPDVTYHREILSTGVNLEFDSAFRWKSADGNPTLDLLTALLPAYPDQIMLGMDAARRSYWKQYGGSPGMTFLMTTWVGRMRAADVSDDQLRRIFVSTPARAFSFAGALT